MKKIAFAIAAVFLLASEAMAQTFDYTPPPLGSSAKVQRDDLQLEYTGINTDKVDFIDLDTCAEIAAIVAGETGTCGSLVLSTSPTLVTPTLGVATATSINKVAVTAPATSATLTIADGATLTASATATVSGTNTGDDDAPEIGDLTAIDTSAEMRSLLTDELGTGVLFFLGAPAADDQVFVSTSTSAGAWLSIPDSDGATQKLQYDVTTNALSAGTDDDIPDAGDFTNLALSGDVVSSALVTTIQANSVALGTDTTNNYMADLAAGAGIAITHTPAEGSTGTVALSYADAGADPALATDACQFTSNATASGFIVCEGDTADTFETRIFVTDPTADRLVTVPNADSATVQPLTCGGTDKVSAISALGVVTCSADAGAAGGDSVTVNGAAMVDPDFDDATPAAVSGANVLWQYSSPNLSGYIPAASTTVIGTVELATSAESEAGTDTVRANTPAGLLAAISGKKTIAIPAKAWTAETTTGCASATAELANGIMQPSFDCDGAGSLQEGIQFLVPQMPKNWDEGTVTLQISWTNASGTGDVLWLASCAAISNDDVMNASFGTEITITDSVTAALDLMISPVSSAITCSGTPAEGDAIVVRVQRDGDNASDTLNSVDARFLGADLFYNINAFTDD